VVEVEDVPLAVEPSVDEPAPDAPLVVAPVAELVGDPLPVELLSVVP
jgi:hypothetical protein